MTRGVSKCLLKYSSHLESFGRGVKNATDGLPSLILIIDALVFPQSMAALTEMQPTGCSTDLEYEQPSDHPGLIPISVH